MTRVPAEILELPLDVRAEMAMKAAVKKVIQEYARAVRPLILWRDGKVVAVPAKELLQDEPLNEASENR